MTDRTMSVDALASEALAGLTSAQDPGHEYELNSAPIREGETPHIPLDIKDSSFNVWHQMICFYQSRGRLWWV